MTSDHQVWHSGSNRRRFAYIPEKFIQDIDSLERECAIYTDHWIDELDDFRHVRIDFTPEERSDFVRRCWAYELFLRTNVEWASEVPGIDHDIAQEADAYSGFRIDGSKINPPYHCFAAFLGSHLEALLCQRSERETIISLQGREAALFEVRRAVQSLTATIRSFNKREKNLAPWTIDCEKDVRDLLYVMLRPRIFDITKEEPIPSRAGTSKRVDLCSKAVQFLVEVKWIGRPGTWKKRIDEIHVDIQTYVKHPASQTVFFIIVDNVRDIQDPRQVEQELTEQQTIGESQIDIVTFICDT